MPLAAGVPGGMELTIVLLLLVIPLGFAYLIAKDAGKRGSSHTLAWGYSRSSTASRSGESSSWAFSTGSSETTSGNSRNGGRVIPLSAKG